MNATTFERKSERHEILLAMVAQEKGCNCQAYQDWFTYKRWQVQGFQVQRGEKGTKLITYIPIEKTDSNGNKKVVGTRPKTTSVFCRCQIKERK